MERWERLRQFVSAGYDAVSAWCYLHQDATDLIVVTLIVGSLIAWKMRESKMRRRLHRMLWGAKMRRSRSRLAYERSGIAFAIEDYLYEQTYQGLITQQSADEWRHAFANRFQMDELLPRRDKETVKRSIRNRLNKGVHRIKAIIPGGPPGVKVDLSYVPKDEPVKKSSSRSKYATASG